MVGVKKVKSRKLRKGEYVEESVAKVDKVVINGASDKKIRNRKVRKSEMIDNAADKKKAVKDVVVKKKVKSRKIRMSMTNAEEKKLDKEIERDDNMSVAVMVIILAVCFIVGISLGYLLYRIAITGAI